MKYNNNKINLNKVDKIPMYFAVALNLIMARKRGRERRFIEAMPGVMFTAP